MPVSPVLDNCILRLHHACLTKLASNVEVESDTTVAASLLKLARGFYYKVSLRVRGRSGGCRRD